MRVFGQIFCLEILILVMEKIKPLANYSGLGHVWLTRTVLASGFIVPIPKMKTQHWAGATLIQHEKHVLRGAWVRIDSTRSCRRIRFDQTSAGVH
jgi:hypothetical protein